MFSHFVCHALNLSQNILISTKINPYKSKVNITNLQNFFLTGHGIMTILTSNNNIE